MTSAKIVRSRTISPVHMVHKVLSIYELYVNCLLCYNSKLDHGHVIAQATLSIFFAFGDVIIITGLAYFIC